MKDVKLVPTSSIQHAARHLGATFNHACRHIALRFELRPPRFRENIAFQANHGVSIFAPCVQVI